MLENVKDGLSFGEPNRGFMRLNIGCTRLALKIVLEQLKITTTAEKDNWCNKLTIKNGNYAIQ